eukprot:GCRY01002472.1.p1 GENE.GCRY01002472.1~~GCRY01002472.1.p1  ORF type:complete len:333 (+),score=79.09 GCRY01002472.1:141-1139(+)
MFLFSKKIKNPSELVKQNKEALLLLTNDSTKKKEKEKAVEEISRHLLQMKTILYGDSENEPNTELVAQLANEIYNNDLLHLQISNMQAFEFEAKKDLAQVFSNLLRRQIGTRSPTVEYICRNPHILDNLVLGYQISEIALNCGFMLRECVRHEVLTQFLLDNLKNFNRFFEYVEYSTFDIASDAFATFRDLLTKHKKLCAEFMEKNYDEVFSNYTKLLTSTNYVTRRQSLKLLGELLLERANFNIMARYIGNCDNLKLMMTLLREKSKNIQFEAFHVFKVFVANPNKPKPVLDILLKNKEKLVMFLSNFQNDKEDEQFNDEKTFLLKQISEL